MRICTVCKKEKEDVYFAKKRGKRSSECKECHSIWFQEHYKNNKKYYVDKSKRRKKELSLFIESLKSKPCMDCGKKYPPYVMDFDHREGEKKRGCISKLSLASSLSKKNLMEEINKCDLVCSNCHRIRTHERLNK